LGIAQRNNSSTTVDNVGMSEVEYFKMQIRRNAARKAAAAEEDEEGASPTLNIPSKFVAASTTPLKSIKGSGTKSPKVAKGKKKGKKKVTKIGAPKPEVEEFKPRKPSPTPKERETVLRIEKMAIIDLDVQREFDSMRKGVMQWSR
jgi:hypothetical protein